MICSLQNFFFKLTFLKKKIINTNVQTCIVSNLDQDQARHSVMPGLDTNSLQRLSSDNKICHCQVKRAIKIKFKDDHWHSSHYKITHMRNKNSNIQETRHLMW